MSTSRNARKLYLTDGRSIECLEYYAGDIEVVGRNGNYLKFILRDQDNRIALEFRHELDMSSYDIVSMTELPNNLFAIKINKYPLLYLVSPKHHILIFNAQKGNLVTEISDVAEVQGMATAGNSIYVGSREAIYKVDLKSGRLTSMIAVSDTIKTMDSLANGHVVLGQDDRNFFGNKETEFLRVCNLEKETLKNIPFDGSNLFTVMALPGGQHFAALCDAKAVEDKEDKTVRQIRLYNTNDNSHSLLALPKSSCAQSEAGKIHRLPNGNLAVAYHESSSTNVTDFVIYPPASTNPVEHLDSVNMPFPDDSSPIAYLEHLDWTRLIALHNTLQSHETLPAPLIKLIVGYASFAHTPAQARAGITNPSEWVKEESRLTFASDKEQKHPVDPSKKRLLAFKKIYQALYDGETTVWKGANFLADKKQFSDDQLIEAMNHKMDNNPRGRTARAWQLALKYYENNLAQNETLFTEIYKQSFSNSGLFKRSTVTGITFFSGASFNKNVKLISKEKIAQHENDNTRTSKIYRALK